jgi:site-specific recombinase XerD
MPVETPPKKVGRGYARNPNAGVLQLMADSFEFHLRAVHKSEKTIATYLDAAKWFAAAHLLPAGVTDWADVRARHVRQWTVWLLGNYADSYASNQFRELQQFFRWLATEDPDEPRPNPMARLSPPKVADKLVPVIADDELAAMLATCKGGGFENRRDHAVIALFKDTGIRLAELAGIALADVDAKDRQAIVTGKGDKRRTVRFTHGTARAGARAARGHAVITTTSWGADGWPRMTLLAGAR